MYSFLDLSTEVEDRFAKCIETNRRPLLSKKKKKAIFIEQSARLLEDFFYKICLELDVTQFVECGAHDAFASRKIVSLIPKVSAVAFEANPYVFANFSELVDSANVRYINKAISNTVGNLELILKSKDTRSWSSEGYLDLEGDQDSSLEKLKVQSTTLDSELKNTLKMASTAFWIDVEGSNRILIEGAEELLRSKIVDVLLIESQVDLVWKNDFYAEQLCEKLSSYGYIPFARDCPRHWGCNILFIKIQDFENLALLKSSYLKGLDSILLPYFPEIQYRTFLSKCKNFLAGIVSPRYSDYLHRFAIFLGSRSSKDKLRG